ncbi:MAG: hypothetical protein HDR21_13810 [Lachnospiraceae bacterium]|nr:hypothetical protein [Lachnospiraceae bacterium]
MAQFYAAVMTNGGAALLADAIAGNAKIQFTTLVAGDGEYTEAEHAVTALQVMTSLKSQKQSVGFSSVVVESETSVHLTGVIDNEELVEGYYVREVGIYAKNILDDEANPVLYSIVVAQVADYMPPYNGLTPTTIIQEYFATVDNSAEITLEAGSGAYALAEDLEAIKAQLESAIFSNMVGATESAAGQAGYVPAPVAGAQGKYLRGDGTWQPVIETLDDVRANTQAGYIAGALALKEALGTTLTDTLAAGAKTLTFTSDAITDDSLIDIYTDPYCNGLTAAKQEGNTLTLTFEAQAADMRVRIKVE